MASIYDNCTQVTDFCVVPATIYGYRPNLGANAFLLAIFAVCLGVQAFQGLKWRTWTFMIAMTLGCLTEVLGKSLLATFNLNHHIPNLFQDTSEGYYYIPTRGVTTVSKSKSVALS